MNRENEISANRTYKNRQFSAPNLHFVIAKVKFCSSTFEVKIYISKQKFKTTFQRFIVNKLTGNVSYQALY